MMNADDEKDDGGDRLPAVVYHNQNQNNNMHENIKKTMNSISSPHLKSKHNNYSVLFNTTPS